MNKIREIFLKQKYAFLSFILSSIGMLFILQYNGVLFGASHALLYGDSLEIYVPAIKNLCRDILNHESIYYSWNTALGMNTSLYNAFYATSPFNIIYLIFFQADENAVTAAIIVLKTGLAAFCFSLFVREAYNVKGIYSVLFAISYSLCSYQISFNIINIIWLDAMFVIPMVFLNIVRIVESRKTFGLFFWYAYIFISQFYMGYMIGIVSSIFFVLCMIFYSPTNYLRVVKRWFLSVLGAVGVSAFLWLPSAYFILYNRAPDSSVNSILHKGILDVLGQMFWGNNNMLYDEFPNLYCGLVTILFFFIFLLCQGVNNKDKIIYLVLLAFVLLACMSDRLYMFFHGFDNPDGWYYRFAFIFCFLFCSVGAISSECLHNTKPRYILLSALFVVLVFIGTEVWNFIHSSELQKIDILRWGVNILAVVAWSIVLCRYEKSDRVGRVGWGTVVLLGVMAEMISSGMRNDFRGRTIELYEVWKDSIESRVEELKDNRDFYRINSLYDMCINSGIFFDYKGVSYFASPENSDVRMELKRLGFYSSQRLFYNYGITPVTEMIFDVKYDLYSGIEDILNSDKNLSECLGRTTINNEVLNLGYLIAGDVEDYIYYGNNAFENNNYLLSNMTGMDIRAFSTVDADSIKYYGTGISIIPEETGYLVYKDPRSHGDDEFIITVDDNSGSKIYTYVYNENTGKGIGNDCFIMEGGYENAISKSGDIRISYIKELEEKDGTHYLRILSQGNVQEARFNDMYFYKLNKDELHEAYDALKEGQMQIESINDGYIKADISVKDDKRILFTSIPYDKGWTVKVNGEKTEISPILNDAFISIVLPGKGSYKLEFEYEASGSRAGIAISVISLLLLGAVYVRERWHKYIV